MNIQITLDTWLENNDTYNAVNQLNELTNELGYRDLEEFLEDNSGCIDAMYDWIGKHGIPEWKDALTPVLRDDIQNLLDKKVIELEHGTTDRYILTNTGYAIIARWDSYGYLVGSIVVTLDRVELYDENDNLINDGYKCEYLEAFKSF